MELMGDENSTVFIEDQERRIHARCGASVSRSDSPSNMCYVVMALRPVRWRHDKSLGNKVAVSLGRSFRKFFKTPGFQVLAGIHAIFGPKLGHQTAAKFRIRFIPRRQIFCRKIDSIIR